MTTNKCVLHGKVTEKILSKETWSILGKIIKKKEILRKKRGECSKRQNFKICKMSMGGNDTHKNKLVKIFKAKTESYKISKEKN